MANRFPWKDLVHKLNFLVLLSSLAAPLSWCQTAAAPAPPPSVAEDTKETIHGVVVSDPYQWLEDSPSTRTRAWIDTQQKYTASLLGQRPELASLREDVFELTSIEEPQRVLSRGPHYYIL